MSFSSEDEDETYTICIADRYELLGYFSDSMMYARDRAKCCDQDFQSIVIVKFTDLSSKGSLICEVEVYKGLGTSVGFPTLLWFGEWGDMYCVVMDYKGCNLDRLQIKYTKELDSRTVALFATQMIERIRHLHNVGFIHGDIKPDNFTFGPEAPGLTGIRGTALVNLIDFSTAIRSKGNGEDDATLHKGTNPAFPSINALLGHRLTERDDMESLAYTLLFLVLGDGVPWISELYSCLLTGTYGHQLMADIKSEIVPEELCDGLPSVYSRFLRYTRELGADAEPDYEFFVEEFRMAYLFG